MTSLSVWPEQKRTCERRDHAPYNHDTCTSVLKIYWYFSGIYHFFDSFGKWYGKEKCGMVKNFLIVLIVLIVLGEVRRAER